MSHRFHYVLGIVAWYVERYRDNNPSRQERRRPLVSSIDFLGLSCALYLLVFKVESWPMTVYLLSACFLFYVSMLFHWGRRDTFWRKLDHYGIWLFICASVLPFTTRPDLLSWVLGAVAMMGLVIKFRYDLSRSFSCYGFLVLALMLVSVLGLDSLVGQPVRWREVTWLFAGGLACYFASFWHFFKQVPSGHYWEVQHCFVFAGFYCHATAGLMLQ